MQVSSVESYEHTPATFVSDAFQIFQPQNSAEFEQLVVADSIVAAVSASIIGSTPVWAGRILLGWGRASFFGYERRVAAARRATVEAAQGDGLATEVADATFGWRSWHRKRQRRRGSGGGRHGATKARTFGRRSVIHFRRRLADSSLSSTSSSPMPFSRSDQQFWANLK